jgi:H+/Cl- antiporter ClcA
MNDKAWTILGRLLLAALLGVCGQLFRVVVGLKKENDQAKVEGQAFKDRFRSAELFTSLGIAVAVGAIAGILSALMNVNFDDPKTLLAFIGAGYSGTDFIEGFMKKALPPQQPPAPQQPAPAGQPQAPVGAPQVQHP